MRLLAITILSIISIIFATGCGKYFSYSPAGELALTDHSLVLDTSYALYIRETYKSGSANDRVMRTNFSGFSLDKKDLIEIEYLVISQEKKNVLYFSTIPDKWQKYYSKHYLGPGMINCYDLRVLYTGKLDPSNGNQLLYISRDAKFTDTWITEYNTDKTIVTLNSIVERQNGEFADYLLVNEALSEPITFVKSDQLKMIYLNPFETKQDTARLLDNRIYFKKAKRKNKYGIYFRFDRILKDGYTDIYFKDKRVLYNPAPLF